MTRLTIDLQGITNDHLKTIDSPVLADAMREALAPQAVVDSGSFQNRLPEPKAVHSEPASRPEFFAPGRFGMYAAGIFGETGD